MYLIRGNPLTLFTSFSSAHLSLLSLDIYSFAVSVWVFAIFSTLRAKQTQELTRNWILIRLLLGLLLGGPVLGTLGSDGPIVLYNVQATVLMRGWFRKEFPALVNGHLLDDAGNA